MILVYTGNGKGKTCACAGQILRALGNGLNVAFGQFMKRPHRAGEQKMLASLLGDNYYAGGIGFFRDEAERASHKEAARQVLAWAATKKVDMLALDEALYALDCGLLQKSDLQPLLERACASSFHLILSGRNCPGWLAETAHMVTEMREVKHHYNNGVPAMRGIEY